SGPRPGLATLLCNRRPRPARAPPFPYTTLFRSAAVPSERVVRADGRRAHVALVDRPLSGGERRLAARERARADDERARVALRHVVSRGLREVRDPGAVEVVGDDERGAREHRADDDVDLLLFDEAGGL